LGVAIAFYLLALKREKKGFYLLLSGLASYPQTRGKQLQERFTIGSFNYREDPESLEGVRLERSERNVFCGQKRPET
jgi:hypothetical protein